MPEDKKVVGWLIVNWKSGQHRTRQSKPTATELGNNELVAKLEVTVTVPDVEVPTLAVDIDVPEPHVRAACLEALSDEEMPDWTDTANDIVAATADQDHVNSWTVDLINAMTTEVLVAVNTRPDPSRVRQYIRELTDDIEP